MRLIQPFTTAEEVFNVLKRVFEDKNTKTITLNNFRLLRMRDQDLDSFSHLGQIPAVKCRPRLLTGTWQQSNKWYQQRRRQYQQGQQRLRDPLAR